MPVDPAPVFAPRVKVKMKTTPTQPPGFTGLGGTFTPEGFLPTKPTIVQSPDQAPFKHGKSPVQTKEKALAQGGEVKLAPHAADPQAAQNAAHTMAMQRMLNAKGAKLSVDGQWGPNTESAYQAYLSHAAQYTKQAQKVDASRNPLFQQAPSVDTVHEQMLLQREAEHRAAQSRAIPEARPQQQYTDTHRYAPRYKGEPVAGWEGTLGPNGLPMDRPYYTDAATHQSHAAEVGALNDQTNFEALFGKQAETDLEKSPKYASPALTGTLEAIGGALPGVGLARAAEHGHLSAGSFVGEAANDLLWLGPGELAAPFKIVGGSIKAARSGDDILAVAKKSMALWREKKLARIENPIIRRDLESSPDRQSFIAAIRDVPKMTGTLQHSTLALMDHNAVTRAAMTGEKPSIAWGKANFGKSTFHDINPTRDEALGTLAQHEGDTHFQERKLTHFPHQDWWDSPGMLKNSEMTAVGMPFVSKLHTLVFDMPPKVGVNELLGKLKSAGIKTDEIRWNKFDEFLAQASAKGQKSVTREEALGWLDKNYLQLEENRRFEKQPSGYGTMTTEQANSDQTKFGNYTLPGGRDANYQEFTIRLPADQYGDLYYYTEHFPDTNIIAHARTTDRTVAGDKSLMIEEIQSDWHQAGQKQGYAVPVTEHPDYEHIAGRADAAGKDLNSIVSTLRRRITDGLMHHPALQEMPDSLVQSFEHTAEKSIGLDASSRTSAQETDRWMHRLRSAQDEHPGAKLHVEVVPRVDGVTYGGTTTHTASGFGIQLHADGKPVEGADGNFGVFWNGAEPNPDMVAQANEQAIHLNNFLQMRDGDKSAVQLGVQALTSAHTQLLGAQDDLMRLGRIASSGVANGPFAKTWHELAFKRMLAEAVDKGYERIAWTTGRTQAERYNLANFFKRIEVQESTSGSSDALRYWADDMARSSVDSMGEEDLGLTDDIESELRDDAASYFDYPNEDQYYVIEDGYGNTRPADPEEDGAILDQDAYDEAMDEYLPNVDDKFDSLKQDWLDERRSDMIEVETEYYMGNAHEYDGPSDGTLTVVAWDHNGAQHEYGASDPGSGEENALENVIGPDLAAKYEQGHTEFEGDGLIAGDNAKSALGASHFYDNKLTGFVNKYLKQTDVQTSMEEIGGEVTPKEYSIVDAQYRPGGSSPGHRFVIEAENGVIVATTHTREEAQSLVSTFAEQEARKGVPASGTVVHSIPITDEVRKFVDQGIVLFQRDPLVRDIKKAQKLAPRMKGAVEIAPGEKTKLHLFAAADVSTVVHELGHSVQEAIPDLAHIDSETFARSFERYFMTAKAPTEDLVLPFADIREGMLNVYGSPLRVPGAKLTPKMKSALDAFFKSAEKDHPDLLRAITAIHFHPAGAQFQAAWSDHEPTDPMEPGSGGPRTNADLVRIKELEDKIANLPKYGAGWPTSNNRQAFERELRDLKRTQFQEGPPEPINDETLATTHEPISDKTPEEALRAGMKGVPMRRGLQNKMRSEERARRAKAYAEALSQGEGIEGHYAALKELKGELPKIDYHGFKELNPEALNYLVNTVRDHPHLLPYQKTRLNIALDKATRGEMPTPSEQVLIEHVFGKDTARGFQEIAGMPAHIQNLMAEILNVPRSVMASFDLSAPFRQGLVISVRHPLIFFGNFPAMFKSFGSERVYQAVMDEVKSRATYPMMVQAKLAITDMESLDKREEQFYSNLAELLTGGFSRKGGFHMTPERSPIRMSGRAYTGFLVKTRADVFDHLIRVAEQQGHDVQSEKFLKDLGRYINAASGRGNLAALQGAAPFLNTVFFSPRLLASRVDLLAAPITYARADPFVRRQALISMFNLAGAGLVILGLASMLPGVTVSGDPRNADFGKIRFGNTRIDILGGFQQPFRLASQFISGKIISSTTGDALVLGPAGPGGVSRQDIVKRFFEGKLAPVPSIINDWTKDTNFQGDKFEWSQEATSHMIPLLAQDAADLYKREHGGMNGIALALAGYAVGAFGIGLQTYGPKNPAQKPTQKLDSEAKKAGIGEPTPALLIDVKHQANLDSLSQKHANDPQGRLDSFLKYYADETGDHQYDKWFGMKLSDDAAQQGADAIRHALVGPGLAQYEAAIRASLKAQGKKW